MTGHPREKKFSHVQHIARATITVMRVFWVVQKSLVGEAQTQSGVRVMKLLVARNALVILPFHVVLSETNARCQAALLETAEARVQ